MEEVQSTILAEIRAQYRDDPVGYGKALRAFMGTPEKKVHPTEPSPASETSLGSQDVPSLGNPASSSLESPAVNNKVAVQDLNSSQISQNALDLSINSSIPRYRRYLVITPTLRNLN